MMNNLWCGLSYVCFMEVFHAFTTRFKQAQKTGLIVGYVHFKYIYLLYNYNFLKL